ncbi:hypothetical protein PHET_05048 [Paragonimus heterotremus]|uniref:Protein kish n=1 Tax=Paragonimus heterotremus TaxID=100268 RepID=A0A8J4X068_9TREM|nr:hypothetical protein PHET_05048 [Paragonimus heterotremus]
MRAGVGLNYMIHNGVHGTFIAFTRDPYALTQHLMNIVLDGTSHLQTFSEDYAAFYTCLLSVILLLICTCTYVRHFSPALLDAHKHGLLGLFWKCARIGERKSPYVALCCVVMACAVLFGS